MNVKQALCNAVSRIYYRTRINNPAKSDYLEVYYRHQIYHIGKSRFSACVQDNNLVCVSNGVTETITTGSPGSARRLMKKIFISMSPWYKRLTRKVLYIVLACLLISFFSEPSVSSQQASLTGSEQGALGQQSPVVIQSPQTINVAPAADSMGLPPVPFSE